MENIVFAFDYSILSFYHTLAESCGIILTPLARVITFIGEKGLLMIALSVIFMLFARTRKAGICMFGSVGCGAVITNFILKGLVARQRPFNALEEFNEWYNFVGAPFEDGFSFPSGHVTAAMAGITALNLIYKNKALLWTYLYVIFMGISRNYLISHYPTDVLGAAAVGFVAASVAYFITILIYRFLEKYKDNSFCGFILEKGFDTCFQKK